MYSFVCNWEPFNNKLVPVFLKTERAVVKNMEDFLGRQKVCNSGVKFSNRF